MGGHTCCGLLHWLGQGAERAQPHGPRLPTARWPRACAIPRPTDPQCQGFFAGNEWGKNDEEIECHFCENESYQLKVGGGVWWVWMGWAWVWRGGARRLPTLRRARPGSTPPATLGPGNPVPPCNVSSPCSATTTRGGSVPLRSTVRWGGGGQGSCCWGWPGERAQSPLTCCRARDTRARARACCCPSPRPAPKVDRAGLGSFAFNAIEFSCPVNHDKEINIEVGGGGCECVCWRGWALLLGCAVWTSQERKGAQPPAVHGPAASERRTSMRAVCRTAAVAVELNPALVPSLTSRPAVRLEEGTGLAAGVRVGAHAPHPGHLASREVSVSLAPSCAPSWSALWQNQRRC